MFRPVLTTLAILSIWIHFASSHIPTVLSNKKATPGYRLENVVNVDTQEVIIEPFLEQRSFDGVAVITAKVTVATKTVILHSRNLDILFAEFEVNDVDVTTDVAVGYEVEKDFLRITYLNTLQPEDQLKLHFRYKGVINDKPHGVYVASYMNNDEEARELITTLFGMTNAREAFPCFDEPIYKSAFKLSIARGVSLHTVSNMRKLLHRTDAKNSLETVVWDHFELSPPMSSYLYAFTISDYETVESDRFYIHARPDAIREDQHALALEVTANFITQLEDLFGPFPLTHLAQIAIPNKDFRFSAMENWGLVSYREKSFLYIESLSTTDTFLAVTGVIAHEITHQWFGNLVTPKWWDNIWLSEGFATLFQSKLVDKWMPLTRAMDDFSTRTTQMALYEDSFSSSRPMTQDAGTPEEINNLLDIIAYEKSASVLKMLEMLVGEAVFRAGLQKYLEGFSYSSATEQNLYNSIENALADANGSLPVLISDIMTTWTSQPGYPILRVSKVNDLLTVDVGDFDIDGSPNNTKTWHVPVQVAYGKNNNITNLPTVHLISSSPGHITLPELVDADFYLVNFDNSGFYRVSYDEANLNSIMDCLISTECNKFDIRTKAKLIDDAFNMARSGIIPYATLFQLCEFLTQERDYFVVHSFIRGLSFLNDMLYRTDAFRPFRTWTQRQLQYSYGILGTNITDESIANRRNRIQVLRWMCRVGSLDCQSKMKNILNQQLDLHPDIQEPVYCGGMHAGAETEWYYLNSLYQSPNIHPYQKERVIKGMACIMNSEFLATLLARSLTLEDLMIFKAVYSATDMGLEEAYNYFLDNFTQFTATFSKQEIAVVFHDLSQKLAQTSDLEKFENFKDSLDPEVLADYEEVFNEFTANFNRNSAWITKNLLSIQTWLEANESY